MTKVFITLELPKWRSGWGPRCSVLQGRQPGLPLQPNTLHSSQLYATISGRVGLSLLSPSSVQGLSGKDYWITCRIGHQTERIMHQNYYFISKHNLLCSGLYGKCRSKIYRGDKKNNAFRILLEVAPEPPCHSLSSPTQTDTSLTQVYALLVYLFLTTSISITSPSIVFPTLGTGQYMYKQN